MSPSRNGSCGGRSPSRNARAAASSRCTPYGHGRMVQVPSCIVRPRYGGRRTTYSRLVRQHFLLDPDVVYLNHGSYGACPRPVFERYQAWQCELEREPVRFFERLPELLADARAALAAYVGADADDLTFVPNATTGVNMAARAL